MVNDIDDPDKIK